MTMHPFLAPLAVFATLAAAFAGRGLSALWAAETGAAALVLVPYLVAAAAQTASVAALASGVARPVAAITWLALTALFHQGLVAAGFVHSAWPAVILVQLLVWLLARSLRPREPWQERLVRWRRGAAMVETHIAAFDGLIPRLQTCWTRVLWGAPAGQGPDGRLPAPPARDLERALTTALDVWIAEIDEQAAGHGPGAPHHAA